MSNGRLPQTIPPQTASLGKADADGNVTIDITWYLLLYNIATQVLNAANGSLTVTPFDLSLLDAQDIAETTEAESTGSSNGVDTADIDAIGADVAKLQPGPRDIDSTDIDASDADAAQLLSALQTAQALIAEIIDSASAIDAANASKLLGATWSAPGAIGIVTPNTGAFSTLSTSGLYSANAGLSIPTGQSITGAGTAAISGFASASLGAISGTTGVFSTNAGSLTVGSAGGYGVLAGVGGAFSLYINSSTRGGAGKTASGAAVLATDAPVYFTDSTTTTIRAVISSTGLAVTGALSATTTSKTGGYTVATLPAGVVGMHAYVTDATAPTYLGALTGGGAVTAPVFYNGAAWVSA